MSWRQGIARTLPVCAELEGHELALAQSYLAFARPAQTPYILGHLGQSLDGRIATASGHAAALTGAENHDHLHRLRAIADMVLVGGGTVQADDPQLTTRRVEGPSPIRAVIDPARRLTAERRLFTDGVAPTWIFCRAPHDDLPGVEQIPVARAEDPQALHAELARRGIGRIFLEGGGVTLSRFMAAGCLDHLQICVAPILLGRGIRGFDLASAASVDQGLAFGRPAIAQGRDWLLDSGPIRCQGRWPALEIEAAPQAFGPVGRILR